MAIKRYWATKDNTITNAYETNLRTRATGSNMGASDILEVFKIYGQASSGTSAAANELTRILIQFPITGSGFYAEGTKSIKADRTAGNIPASGSVNFYLKLFNAPHSQTTPQDYEIIASALTKGFDEGTGLDMDGYTDKNNGNPGSDWVSASFGVTWTKQGGDWDDDDSSSLTASFDTGIEDMEINITPIVEQVIAGSKNNYGLILRLGNQQESYGTHRSYYTKKFFGRNSQYFFKRPVIEARWNSSVADDRGSFYYSSSLATQTDNLNSLYFYNYVRGRLRSAPLDGDQKLLVSLYSGSSGTPAGSKFALSAGGSVVSAGDINATASEVSTGVYAASISVTGSTSTVSTIYDVWQVWEGSTKVAEVFTGSIKPKKPDYAGYSADPTYVTTMPNLQKRYNRSDNARLRLYTREKDWCPTIYNKANNTIEGTIIHSASFRVTRDIDGLEVIPFGTGSDLHTLLSHDVSGNYCELDFKTFAAGYSYTIDYSFYEQAVSAWVVQPYKFRFRVDK
jgi:hypothetical protein